MRNKHVSVRMPKWGAMGWGLLAGFLSAVIGASTAVGAQPMAAERSHSGTKTLTERIEIVRTHLLQNAQDNERGSASGSTLAQWYNWYNQNWNNWQKKGDWQDWRNRY